MSTDALPEEDGELPEPSLEKLEELNEKSEDELSDAEVTSKIKLSVRKRFDFPTWVLVYEFQNRDGRRADCLAFNTMPSRGFPLVGFEFKASRSDWLAEKKDHQKADQFVQMCDEWYVVAGRRGIVEESELPNGWGLLELKPEGSLWKLVDSDLDDDLQSTGLDRRFMAKFMQKTVGKEANFGFSDLQEAERRGVKRGKDTAVDRSIDRETKKLREHAENWRRVNDAGLNIYGEISEGRVERLKRAESLVKAIESDDFGDLEGRLESLEHSLTREFGRIYEDVEVLFHQLEEIREAVPGGDGSDE